MKKYTYEVIETTKFIITVEAQNGDEASDKVGEVMTQLTNFHNQIEALTEPAEVSYQSIETDYDVKSIDGEDNMDDDSDNK